MRELVRPVKHRFSSNLVPPVLVMLASACGDPPATVDEVDASSTGSGDGVHDAVDVSDTDTDDSGGSDGDSSGSETGGDEDTGEECPPDAPTWCDWRCSNTTYDFENCGACGVECGEFDFCVDGTCTLHCWPGWAECAGTCLPEPELGAHCELCGTPCPSGWVCDGSCVDTREWGEPTLLTPICLTPVFEQPVLCEGVMTSPVEVAIDGNGNAIAVWGQGWHVWASRYDADDDAWTSPVMIESNPGDAMSPHLAMDAGGNAIAVWHESEGFTDRIWANRYDAMIGGWGTPELVAPSFGHPPMVAMTDSGDALVVWSYGQARFNRYDALEGAWGTQAMIPPAAGGESGALPHVAASSAGETVGIWRQPAGGPSVIAGGRYDIGTGSWGALATLEMEDGIASMGTHLAMGPDGRAVAVWRHGTELRASRYDPGAPSWGVAEPIANSVGSPHAAVDATGNALVVWSDNGIFTTNRYDAFLDAWAGVSSPYENATTPQTGAVDTHRVGVDAAGNGVAAWSRAYLGLWTGRYDTWADTWTQAERIDDAEAGDVASPRIAVNPGGRAVATWRQGTLGAVWVNRLR
jgi:hypothetical protein